MNGSLARIARDARALLRLRRPRAMPSAFAIGFVFAVTAAVVLTVRVLAQVDMAPDEIVAVLVACGFNLALIAGLVAVIALRLRRMVKVTSDDEPAPRLHLRFVMILGLGAVIPAILSAVILGLAFVRFVDEWFSPRIESVVDGAASIARVYLSFEGRIVGERLGDIARDLNQPEAVTALATHRITYASYLREQAALREFEAAYVLDGEGTVLAAAELSDDMTFAIPRSEDFALADQGEAVFSVDRTDGRIRVLFRLTAYDDAYLFVVRELGEGVMPQLTGAEEAVVAYRAAEAARNRMRVLLALIFLQWALLVTLGAAWFGLTAANRFVAPIGRLASAAQRVRDGDLDARVDLGDRVDELAALARAFNEMTTQLATQRAELVEASETAEERRAFTEAVLEGVSAGVIGVDGAGQVTLVNRSAMELLELQGETDIIGCEAVVALPEFAPLLREARNAGGVVSAQIGLERAGRARHLNARAGVSSDGDGAIVATFDDITRLVSAQRSAAWRDVARRIAHEIKNPLTPIQLSAERLRRKYRAEIVTDPDVFERCTDTIVRQVSDIGRMVDEFSAFARMPAPKLESVDLTDLVNNTAFAQRVASPDITFEAVTPDEPVYALCDERLVAQALANILKNAAEAISTRKEQEDPGGRGAPGRVEAELKSADGWAVIEVRDNGAGWPTADRESLVEPYMTTRERGTGLGLAIVRRVMEDHNGRLELDEREDGARGAVVRLVLPQLDAAQATAGAAAAAGGAG